LLAESHASVQEANVLFYIILLRQKQNEPNQKYPLARGPAGQQLKYAIVHNLRRVEALYRDRNALEQK